jgi:hypothetical protein
MKIKEFFKNCKECYHVYFEIIRPDDSQKEVRVINGQEIEVHEVENREIYTNEDFNNFINDYGDEEFEGWSVEDNEEDTIITFYLK